jgi:hypothetical protein
LEIAHHLALGSIETTDFCGYMPRLPADKECHNLCCTTRRKKKTGNHMTHVMGKNMSVKGSGQKWKIGIKPA